MASLIGGFSRHWDGIFVRAARKQEALRLCIVADLTARRGLSDWERSGGRCLEGAGFPRRYYSRIGDFILGARRNLYPPS